MKNALYINHKKNHLINNLLIYMLKLFFLFVFIEQFSSVSIIGTIVPHKTNMLIPTRSNTLENNSTKINLNLASNKTIAPTPEPTKPKDPTVAIVLLIIIIFLLFCMCALGCENCNGRDARRAINTAIIYY